MKTKSCAHQNDNMLRLTIGKHDRPNELLIREISIQYFEQKCFWFGTSFSFLLTLSTFWSVLKSSTVPLFPAMFSFRLEINKHSNVYPNIVTFFGTAFSNKQTLLRFLSFFCLCVLRECFLFLNFGLKLVEIVDRKIMKEMCRECDFWGWNGIRIFINNNFVEEMDELVVGTYEGFLLGYSVCSNDDVSY